MGQLEIFLESLKNKIVNGELSLDQAKYFAEKAERKFRNRPKKVKNNNSNDAYMDEESKRVKNALLRKRDVDEEASATLESVKETIKFIDEAYEEGVIKENERCILFQLINEENYE